MAIAPVRVWRGLLVWLHLISAVTWMSQALTLLVLLSSSAVSPPGEFKVATAEVAELLDLKILGTSAVTAAFTGFGLAAVTTWGYFHHWWVSAKFVLTLLQILTGTLVVGGALPDIVAAARAGTDGPVLSSAVAVGLVAAALAFQVWLSVAKPWGRTARGRRAQARRAQGRLSTAPAPVVATVFVAALLDVLLGIVIAVPLPAFSLPALILALAERRRRTRHHVVVGSANPSASASGPGNGIGAADVIVGVVVGRADLAPDVASLRLRTADGSPLPSWEPGAHIDLHLASGKVRQYSLHGDPADRSGYDVSVLREPAGRGASPEIHEWQVGTPIGIGGPRNHFPLVEAPSYLFIAGGIGITALKPMIEKVHSAGTPWRLIYRGRVRSGMPFADELEARCPDRVQILPADTTPRPDLPALLRSVPAGGAVYCCGPQTLMDAVSAAMGTACPRGNLHLERFTAAAKDDSRNEAFQVVLLRTGTIVEVSAAKGMLESLRDTLSDPPASCETGVCGSCEMRVLAGHPEHRDDILVGTDRERTDIVYPCVSRSRGALLVLDA